MLFFNDFTLNSVQHIAVKFKRNSVRSQRTAVCSKDRFLSGAYRDFANVLIVKHTQSMRTVDFRFFLYGSMFDV